MGTAKFYEEKLERLNTSLSEQNTPDLHPSIAASRAIPTDRTANPKRMAANAAKREEFVRNAVLKNATKERQLAEQEALLTVKADATLRLRNVRLLKHIRLLEDVVRLQAAELVKLSAN